MSLYDEVKKHVMMSLRGINAPQADQIRNHINAVVQMQQSLGRTDEIDQEALFRDILSQVNTWQADASVLKDGNHADWLPGLKTKIQWGFWRRYRRYLEEEKNWPSTITAKLDRITDLTLGDIGNPAQQGQWDRRGMVIGEVQSGKTANYTGLICKAVDAGYQLIIVLAGLTNDLRSQTQSRLDAEFLGFESEVGKVHSSGSRIGVGLIDEPGQLIVHPLTYSSKDGDFRVNKSANLQLGGSPLLLVVKKNAAILRRILTWVQNQGKVHPETGQRVVDGVPLLLLDDEADNASVNTKSEDEDPTAINRAIRQILNSFQQKSYVGYTATPFANIFVLPDEENESEYGRDLFPKSFIYYISPPSNYVGPAQLFGLTEDLDGGDNTTEGMPQLICEADDAERIFPPSHRRELVIEELPASMITAIRSFIITCAARRVRGQKDVHNSMLIHVTRFNHVQRQVLDLVATELGNMKRIIEYNTGAQATEFFREMETLWNEDYVPTHKAVCAVFDDPQLVPVKWENVRDELLNAISKILVRAINGDRNIGSTLDYSNHPDGLNVIAIGGDKLSRGITLEGLSISYYVRPARNYDTLLQMGRWFGYRSGYLDLCRIYTTDDLIGWYQHIAVANEELRRQFIFMELSRQTPAEFGLKVRTHPNGLNITAANKIRHGRRMQVSFSDDLTQTYVFRKNAAVQLNNFQVTEQWLRLLPAAEKRKEQKSILWKDLPAQKIIDFLKNYKTDPLCPRVEPNLLIRYIQSLLGYNELTKWTVALISSSASGAKLFTIVDHEIGLIKRTPVEPKRAPGDQIQHSDLYMLRNSNIISPSDQYIDLTEDQVRQALERTKLAWQQRENKRLNEKEPQNPSGLFVRQVRSPENGLLLLYPLDHTTIEPAFVSQPIMGFAISFPKSSRGEASAIEYQVNTTYWRDQYGEDEDDA